jgi:hypothetical protein
MFQSYPTKLKRVGLSFGIDKLIHSLISEHAEITQEQFEEIVISSYAVIYDEETIKSVRANLIERVSFRISELVTNKEEQSRRRLVKTFGTAYADWLGGLSATESCLYLADYDIEKALKYYWEEDYLLVQEAVRAKSSHEVQRSIVQLESCMYGAGNRYENDSPNDVVMDISDPAAKAALAEFGF